MPVLVKSDTIAGPLTAQDLDAASQHSTGNVWLLPRRDSAKQCPPCNGDCRQGRDCTGPDTIPTDWRALSSSCAPEGGKHAEPVPTKTHQDRPGIGIALVLAPWLVGVIAWALYVRWAT